jgi:Domain of unknown function (DUF4440)
MTKHHAMLETLRELDSRIDELASKGEFDALGSLLAPDFRYNHSTGHSQSKSEWLAGLGPLVGRRDRLASSIEIELHGDLAVAMGDLDIVWMDGRHNYDRYVRVYRVTDGNWLAVSQRTVPAHDRAPVRE